MLGNNMIARPCDSISNSNNFDPLTYEIEKPKFIINGSFSDFTYRIFFKIAETYESPN